MSRPVRPIAPALIPSPPAHAPTHAEAIAPCIACGAVHGGVGAGKLCLENEVKRLRARLHIVQSECLHLANLGKEPIT